MNFSGYEHERNQEINDRAFKLLKNEQKSIKLSKYNSHLLQRIVAGFSRHTTFKYVSSSLANPTAPTARLIKYLEHFGLITSQINKNNLVINLKPTKFGQKVCQVATLKTPQKLRKILKHKDKVHSVIRKIWMVCGILFLLPMAYIAYATVDIQAMAIIDMIAFIISVLCTLYILTDNDKHAINVSVYQMQSVYKEYNNKDYPHFIKEIQLQWLKDVHIYESVEAGYKMCFVIDPIDKMDSIYDRN